MRTRLDEIVEEELKSWHASGGMDMDLFKRVAERAFRHGVEQALIERFAPSVFSPPNIQPAPATGTDTVYYLRGGGSVYFPDGRTGERRKGKEHRHSANVSGSPWYWLTDNPLENAKADRRSGKDRRKK